MNDVLSRIEQQLASAGVIDLIRSVEPRGVVTRVADDVVWVAGLDGAGYEDLVAFDSGALGLALDLGNTLTGVIAVTGGKRIATGEGARPLDRQPAIVASQRALGRIVDPLGLPIDGGSPLPGRPVPMFGQALEFIDRKDVDQPLATGVMIIDAAIPIGRGQRELVIGDRNTGKTALALDCVAAQRDSGVICVYVLIGQPLSRVLSVREELERTGAAGNTVVVAADASTSAGMQYLAPYAGAAIAEFFRDEGMDVLVVYDDLTKHADAYRELALLLERPPGREAYPGDIFYIHAELLERASARRLERGGGSITALPIVETTDGDLSGYIPTNLISITDGQIYLDPSRHERNERPAVDVGRSVSRIGGRAQSGALRDAARNLRILVSRFEELEALARVGLEVDASTARTLCRGRILRELLRQPRFTVRSVAEQVFTLTAVSSGWLDDVPPDRARRVVDLAFEHDRFGGKSSIDGVEAGSPQAGDARRRIEQVIPDAIAADPS